VSNEYRDWVEQNEREQQPNAAGQVGRDDRREPGSNHSTEPAPAAPTPRTDAAEAEVFGTWLVPASFARQLERENQRLRSALEDINMNRYTYGEAMRIARAAFTDRTMTRRENES